MSYCFCILGVQTNFINHAGARVIVQVVSELSRAKRVQQSTVGKKIWYSTHPRKFGNHVAARPTDRPHHRHTDVK